MAVVNGPKQATGAGNFGAEIRARLDAYVHGESDLETLAAAIPGLCKTTKDAVWEVLSVLDQYHRRGALSDDAFRMLKASTSSIALGPSAADRSIKHVGVTPASPADNASHLPAARQRSHRPGHSAARQPTRAAPRPALEPPPETLPPDVAEHLFRGPSVVQAQQPSAAPNDADNASRFNQPVGTAGLEEPPTEDVMQTASSRSSTPATQPVPPNTAHEKASFATPETTRRREPTMANAKPAAAPFIEATAKTDAESVTKPRSNLGTQPAASGDGAQTAALESSELTARQAAIAKSVVPGRMLRDRYVIESALAFGRNTAVFRARDGFRSHDGDSFVAIKILLIGSANNAAQFENELRIAQRLAHPNVVKVFDLDRDGELLFFAMELIEGQTLAELVEDSPPLRPQAVAILTQLARGLNYLHERNIVHGDVNPANVMVASSGAVKLLDFGSAAIDQTTESWLSATTSIATASGAALYASCERLEGLPLDKRDDIFSLSCIAYELLGHDQPFRGKLATRARDAQQLPARIADLTPAQWRTLQQGLAFKRIERMQSVRDWLRGLEGRAAELLDVGIEPAAPESSAAAVEPAEAMAFVAATAEISNGSSPPLDGRSSSPSPIKAKRRTSLAWYATFAAVALVLVGLVAARFEFEPGSRSASSAATAVAAARTNSPERSLDAATAVPGETPSVDSELQARQASSEASSVAVAAATSSIAATAPAVANTTAPVKPLVISTLPSEAQSDAENNGAPVAPAVVANSAPPQPITTPSPTVHAAAAAKAAKAKAERVGEAHGSISFARDAFTVNKKDGAARIALKRDGGSAGKVSFSWWPEPGTAEPGKDFMSLGKKVETLESGQREIAVFVPLISGSDNDNRHVFFVELSDPSNGLTLGRITRARVIIGDE